MVEKRKVNLKVVIDTSVIVSHCLSKNPTLFTDIVNNYSDSLDIITCDELLVESLTRVKQKIETGKVKKSILEIENFFQWLCQNSQIYFFSESKINHTRDKTDDFIVDFALTHKCDYLLTYDEDLFILEEKSGVKICKPSQLHKFLTNS